MSLELYQRLTAYGAVYEINLCMSNAEEFIGWTEHNFEYVQYNPRKPIARYGLSITSLDGGLSGVPDLDSVLEYNRDNNTSYDETYFNVPTPVYEHPSVRECFDPIKNNICRTHILKLDPGGFFPPHRDIIQDYFSSFRLIIPLKNANPPALNFMLDGSLLHWNIGSVYFVDTAKMHYLFNAGSMPSYLIVANVNLNETTVKYIASNLKFT